MAISLEQLRSRLHDLESKLGAPHTSHSLSASTSLSSSFSDGCPSLSASSSVSSSGFSEAGCVAGLSQSASSSSRVDLSSPKEYLDYFPAKEGGDSATPKPEYNEHKEYFPLVGKLAKGKIGLEGSTSGSWDKNPGRRHRSWGYRTGGPADSTRMYSKKAGSMAGDFTCRTDNTRVELASDTISVFNRQRRQGGSVLSDPGFRLTHGNAYSSTCSTSGGRFLLSKKKMHINPGLGVPASWTGDMTPRASVGPENIASSKALDDPPSNIMKQDASKSLKSSRNGKILPIDLVLAFVNTPSPIDPLPSPVLSETSLGLDRGYKRLRTTSFNHSAQIGLGISVEGLSYPTTIRS